MGVRQAQRCATLGMALVVSAASSPAFARELDGASIEKLANQGTWVTSNTAAHSGAGHWTWNADGSVCLQLFGPEDKCADTGTWRIVGDTMCYEFEWWGDVEDMRALCFNVVALGSNLYEARYTGSGITSSLFRFQVASPSVQRPGEAQ